VKENVTSDSNWDRGYLIYEPCGANKHMEGGYGFFYRESEVIVPRDSH